MIKLAKTKKSFEIICAIAILQILSLPQLILAQATPPAGVSVLSVSVGNVDINTMLMKIRNYFFGIVIVACVFMVLWGAYDIVTGSGDEKKITDAKRKIFYALIGLIVAAMASVIVGLVRSIAS